MSTAAHEFHSPLSLLHQWHERPDGAPLREMLVLGYTLDLVFFERHCASEARMLGARVTVLGDAEQATHEAVDVRHAGLSYQHGHARCAGAFHPKLMVLEGDESVWVAIGSGNPTISGWGHNEELWLVLRASRGETGPAALRDLGNWLVDLPHVVAMPSWIGDTVSSIGKSITPTRTDDSLPRLRMFGNLRRPLLEQLPRTPTQSLRLTAPHFDSRAQAVRKLASRLPPEKIEIALQPTLSQYDGTELSTAAATTSRAEFRHLSEARTSHGKLVEWTADAVTTALVGSANLTVPAMLTSTVSGGNCELVTSCPVSESLLPAGSPTAPDAIRGTSTIRTEPRDPRRTFLTLLGARRRQEEVAVELTTNTRSPVTIETSPDGTPATWMSTYVVCPSTDDPVTAEFRAPEQSGGAIRAWTEDAGARIFSSVVFLTDTSRCLRRDDGPDQPKLKSDHDRDEIFTDQELANRFNADLSRLLNQAQQLKGSTAVRASAPATGTVSTDDRWGLWLQQTERVLGPSLTGLVFPGENLAPEKIPTGWTVGSETDDTELAEDESEELLDALPDQPSVTTTARGPDVPPSQRQYWRKRIRHLRGKVCAQPRPPLELRMTVARLYLDLLAAGVWETDESWRAELRDIIQALVPTEEEDRHAPTRALSFLHSLTAVCLALLFQDASPYGDGEHNITSKAAWNNAGEWTVFAEPQLIEGYLHVPDQPYARVARESEVTEVIELAREIANDPYAELRAVFKREGLSAERMDGVWVVNGDFRNPRRTAARVATRAGAQCVVLAHNEHKACLVLHGGTTLVVAESATPRWRIYRLSPMSTPLSMLVSDEGLPSTRANHPLEPVPAQVRELADSTGVELTQWLAALRTFR